MRSIAVIPARGGSKRLVRKNIRDFMGKPLMAWTIEAAQQAGVFDRILLSTDDEEFAEVGRKWGLDVPFLRDHKNDDLSPVSEATIAAVRQAEAHWGESWDVVVQLMANAPLRTAEDVRDHHRRFVERACDFQISVFPFGWMNPWWAIKLPQGAPPEWIFPEARTTRSQDLPKLYCPTGAIWIAKWPRLAEANTFYGEGYECAPVDWKSAVDIDDQEDFDFAEALFTLRERSRSCTAH